RDLAAPMRIFQLLHPALPDAFPPLRSLTAEPGNLPGLRSSFVGREREVKRLRELMKSHRLLTLIGVGGVGKTRLALQVAVAEAGAYPGGTWLVELARTGDPDSVASVAAVALDAAPQPGRSDTDLVCEHLSRARALLVLDNCEHLVDAAAEFVVEV